MIHDRTLHKFVHTMKKERKQFNEDLIMIIVIIVIIIMIFIIMILMIMLLMIMIQMVAIIIVILINTIQYYFLISDVWMINIIFCPIKTFLAITNMVIIVVAFLRCCAIALLRRLVALRCVTLRRLVSSLLCFVLFVSLLGCFPR